VTSSWSNETRRLLDMDFDEIHQILALMREHGLAEFELEREDLHLRLRKAEAPAPTIPVPGGLPATPVAFTGPAESPPVASDIVVVEAPILGTFYGASGPDAAAFVQIGDVVKPGDVLCIIEAMKLMNDIKSEYAGEVVDVFAENGHPVQYGERLFAIRRS